MPSVVADTILVPSSLTLARSKRPENQSDGARRVAEWHSSGEQHRPLAGPSPRNVRRIETCDLVPSVYQLTDVRRGVRVHR